MVASSWASVAATSLSRNRSRSSAANARSATVVASDPGATIEQSTASRNTEPNHEVRAPGGERALGFDAWRGRDPLTARKREPDVRCERTTRPERGVVPGEVAVGPLAGSVAVDAEQTERCERAHAVRLRAEPQPEHRRRQRRHVTRFVEDRVRELEEIVVVECGQRVADRRERGGDRVGGAAHDERRERRTYVERDLVDIDDRELGEERGRAPVEGRFVGGTDAEGESGDDGTMVVPDVGGDAVDHHPFE